MVKCVRADEANHRDVNHAFANLDQKKGDLPLGFPTPESGVLTESRALWRGHTTAKQTRETEPSRGKQPRRHWPHSPIRAPGLKDLAAHTRTPAQYLIQDMFNTATAKMMMGRATIQPLHRRQALTAIKRQRFSFPVAPASTHFFSTSAASIHPPTAAEPEKTEKKLRPEPTDATNEPAYKAHFTESKDIHPLHPTSENGEPVWDNPINHAVYDLDKIAVMEQTHHPVVTMNERLAYYAIKALRVGFDKVSGYRGPGGGMTEKDWLHRCLFLESVAGVPGMVGGMLRHLRSLRRLKRDYGWIHTLLEEAENERMHLLIFMNLKQPGWFFRALVVGAQAVFFNGFFFTYMFSPKTCHRFVGYLEEEAVKTYTYLLQDIEDGHLDVWKEKKAPLIAQTYYKLQTDANIYDMIKCIRADECNHRDVNHTFANLDQKKGVSPYIYSHHSGH
ncbi:hypothetical protein BBJ28_00012167 [Nothophytophthora sp. Chile5]|nr:hypothetical protein BBJ28_00012167 [Nothophytophthora sp. Chile5]